MAAATATVLCGVVTAALFALSRDPKEQTSSALWLPVIWMSIGGSRMVSQWLQMAPQSSADQLLDGSPLDRNILSVLIVAGLLVLAKRRAQVIPLVQGNGPVLAFLAYCAVSTLWSDYPYVALKRWTKACGDVVMVLIVLSECDRPAAIRRLLGRIAFLLIPASILLIKYYPALGRGYSNWTWTPVVTGVTTNKNLLGMICFISGVGAVWRGLRVLARAHGGSRLGAAVAEGVLLGMVVWLFWLANSVTSLLCFLVACTLMAAARVRRISSRPVLLHMAVLMAVFLSAAVLFLGVGDGLLGAVGRDSTLTGRTDVWKVALAFRENALVGAGFESFWLGERLERIWDVYWWRPNEAHNGYLEVFLNLGWIGLIFLLIVILHGYRNIVRSVRSDVDTGAFRFGFFGAAVAYNFTEAAVRPFHPTWVLLLVTLMACETEPEEARASVPLPAHEVDPGSRWSPRDSGNKSGPRWPRSRTRPSQQGAVTRQEGSHTNLANHRVGRASLGAVQTPIGGRNHADVRTRG